MLDGRGLGHCLRLHPSPAAGVPDWSILSTIHSHWSKFAASLNMGAQTGTTSQSVIETRYGQKPKVKEFRDGRSNLTLKNFFLIVSNLMHKDRSWSLPLIISLLHLHIEILIYTGANGQHFSCSVFNLIPPDLWNQYINLWVLCVHVHVCLFTKHCLNPVLVGLLIFREKTMPKIKGKWQAGINLIPTWPE